MFKTDVQKLRNALEFTRVYKENANDIYLREAACMDFQLRHILVPMDENDGIAGRYEHDFVGFSSQVGGIYTYYFNEHEFLNAYMACKQNGEITAAEDYALQAVQAYWHEENRLNWNFRSATAMCRRKLFPVRAWATATAAWQVQTSILKSSSVSALTGSIRRSTVRRK